LRGIAAIGVLAGVVLLGRLDTGPVTGLSAQQRPSVTYTSDVAPLVFASCATCHRPTGSAPFSLLTYEETRAQAERIVAATARRFMPPWKPEPGHGEFAGNRRLTDDQIAVFRQWAESGTPEGDPAALPPLPRWSGRWQLGEPDLVLQTGTYTLRATGDDMYRNFVLPVRTDRVRYVRAWEFLPGNTRVVHHATMQFDKAGASRELDDKDPQPGYEGLIAHSVASPDGFFLDWGPGHMPYVAPDGMAWVLLPGTDLVMMLHLRPSGQPETLQGTLGLYLTDEPPARTPTLVRLTRQHLDIPAGESRYPVIDTVTLPVPVDVYTVQPHAHYLAREVKGFANLPDGTQRPLIYIRDWDFDWQGVYRYARPVPLPAGTTIRMEYVYDNSSGNARNPFKPPHRVSYGQRTTDEMAELWFQVVTRNAEDRATLVRYMQSHVLPEEIVGHERMLAADPSNTALHNGVALLHVQVGNLTGAASHFSETQRLEPDSPQANYNLGMARLLQGNRDEAGRSFERALALDPGYALAHDGLGLVQQGQGNLDAAVASFERAVQLAPDRADARHHLAAALRARGRLAEAAVQYRALLRLDPARAGARDELASVDQALGSAR
jgi:Flp pilus assembly protein TadD/mono/diheme cytochrome c family protein